MIILVLSVFILSAINTASAVEGTADLVFGIAEVQVEEAGGVAQPGGGGGGSGRPPVVKEAVEIQSFLVAPGLIKLKLKQLDSFGASFAVQSNVDESIILKIDFGQLKDKIKVSHYVDSVTVGPREEKIVRFNITAAEDVVPGLYTGRIIITSEDKTEEVSVIIEVETRRVLFDVSLALPPEFRKAYAGQEITIIPTIFNLADIPKANIELVYLIKDFEGTTVFESKEQISLKSQVSFSKKIKLPEGLKEGKYVVSVYAKYRDSLGVSSETFDIVKKDKFAIIKDNIFNIMIILVFIIIIVGVFISIRMQHKTFRTMQIKTKQKPTRIKETVIVGDSADIYRLRKKLESLEKSYGEGYITEKTYKESKDNIEKALKKL